MIALSIRSKGAIMKKILLILAILSLPAVVNGVELDKVSPPAKNMTEGGMFSDPEVIPALTGDVSALKEDKRVFIPYFKVNYNKEVHSSSTGEASTLTSITRAKVQANVEIKGFSEDIFQKITDLAYEDLAVKLAKKGLTIISREEAMEKSESFQDALKDGKKEFPDIDEEASVYVATNTSYPTGFFAGLRPDGSLSIGPNDIQNDLDSGAVVVGYDVSYVNVVDNSQDGSVRASAELSLAPVANVVGYFQAFTDGDVYRLDMGQVAYSEIAFGHLENSTSAGTKAAVAGVALLGALMGSGNSLDIEDYTLTVEETKFVEATLDALKKANDGFVSTL